MKFLQILIKYLSYDAPSQSNDPADADKLILRLQDTTVTQIARNKVNLASGASDIAMPLPSTPLTYLLVSSDNPVTLNLNGNAFPLAPLTPGTKGFLFFMRGTISSLSFSNPGLVAANVDVILAE